MSIEELRRRVHAAADKVEVPPPPADLLSGNVRRLPGRRGLGVALAAAAAVLAVIGIGAVVVDRDDDRDSARVTATEEKATAGALLAVALDHADVRPSSLESLSDADLRYGRGTVGGDIRFSRSEGDDGELLRVTATPGRLPRDLCDTRRTCDRLQTGEGEVVLRWEPYMPEEDPGIVAVARQAQGEWHQAYYAGQVIDRDPREIGSLPVSVDDMVAIITDPRFGLRTTADAVAAGEELQIAGEDSEPGTAGGSVDDATPRGMAGFVQEQLQAVSSARPSTFEEPAGPTGEGEGVHVQLTYGTELDLLLVTRPGDRPLTCPAGYRCFRGDDRAVYGWTPRGSDLVVMRDRGDFAVRLWIHDPEFSVSSREDFLDNVLVQLADLTDNEALAPEMRADLAEVPVRGWRD